MANPALNETLCIDCYEREGTLLDNTLCRRCYGRAHRKSHYHNVIKLDPERLAAHRQQCAAGMRQHRAKEAGRG